MHTHTHTHTHTGATPPLASGYWIWESDIVRWDEPFASMQVRWDEPFASMQVESLNPKRSHEPQHASRVVCHCCNIKVFTHCRQSRLVNMLSVVRFQKEKKVSPRNLKTKDNRCIVHSMWFAHIEHTIVFSTVWLINYYMLVQNTFIMAQRQKQNKSPPFPSPSFRQPLVFILLLNLLVLDALFE